MPGKASGYITSPVTANLKFEAVRWSPSTKGTVRGNVVLLDPPETPTPTELDSYLASMASKVTGGIVMVGRPAEVPVNFNPRSLRTPDDQVRERHAPRDPNAPARGGRGFGRGRGAPPPEGHLSARDVTMRVNEFLKTHMPAPRLNSQGAGAFPG